jgi:tetratricopeptide (TPR) repeat protein
MLELFPKGGVIMYQDALIQEAIRIREETGDLIKPISLLEGRIVQGKKANDTQGVLNAMEQLVICYQLAVEALGEKKYLEKLFAACKTALGLCTDSKGKPLSKFAGKAPIFYARLGWAYYLSGNYPEAQVKLKRALSFAKESQPNYAELANKYATVQALLALQRATEALLKSDILLARHRKSFDHVEGHDLIVESAIERSRARVQWVFGQERQLDATIHRLEGLIRIMDKGHYPLIWQKRLLASLKKELGYKRNRRT